MKDYTGQLWVTKYYDYYISNFHGTLYIALIENWFQGSNFTLKLYHEMYVQFPLMLVLARTTDKVIIIDLALSLETSFLVQMF